MVTQRVTPNGTCWCGCGAGCGRDSFFQPGHDRIAEAGLVKAEYGSVALFLDAHGYGPGGKSAHAPHKQSAWR